MEEKDPVTEKIIAMCFEVHNALGPGFPERIYHNALIALLQEKGIPFYSEKEFPVYFKDKKMGSFKCDLLIEEVIVELKSVEGVMPKLFRNKLIAYLRAAHLKTGLLINFGNTSCDIKRVTS